LRGFATQQISAMGGATAQGLVIGTICLDEAFLIAEIVSEQAVFVLTIDTHDTLSFTTHFPDTFN
jgi:hypothetical protein